MAGFAILRPVNSSIFRTVLILQALQASAWASNTVVNLSHYDLMRPGFAQMRQEGIVAVIHEATYPRFARDDRYSARQRAAVGAGLLWGAYHFADSTDPTRQADHLLNVVERSWRDADPEARPNEVLLVLDFEKNGHYPGGTMRVDQAVTFVERIKARTGNYPGLYAGQNRLLAIMKSPRVTSAQRAILSRCWLWIANYHYEPRALLPWSDWTMWQYTGDGVCDLPRAAFPISVANIRRAERNLFRGSASELRGFWRRHGWMPGE